jgi:hypothetical protein
MIESETRNEMQQCLFSYDNESGNQNDEFEQIKARKLTESFMQVEPLLVEMIETFRDKFFAELSTEVDKLVEKDFYGYTKVDSTLGF